MHSRRGATELAKELFRIGALRFGDFALSSGRRSGYYLDLRRVPSHPEVYSMVLDAYREMAIDVGLARFDAIAGVATAGVTISSPLAVMLRKPMVYIRRESKAHGLGKVLEGDIERGSRVIVVDDLVTTGESLAEASHSLRSEGCKVEHALVLVDRLEGGSSRLADVGVVLKSYITVEDVASELRALGLVDEAETSFMVGRETQRLSAGGETG